MICTRPRSDPGWRGWIAALERHRIQSVRVAVTVQSWKCGAADRRERQVTFRPQSGPPGPPQPDTGPADVALICLCQCVLQARSGFPFLHSMFGNDEECWPLPESWAAWTLGHAENLRGMEGDVDRRNVDSWIPVACTSWKLVRNRLIWGCIVVRSCRSLRGEQRHSVCVSGSFLVCQRHPHPRSCAPHGPSGPRICPPGAPIIPSLGSGCEQTPAEALYQSYPAEIVL